MSPFKVGKWRWVYSMAKGKRERKWVVRHRVTLGGMWFDRSHERISLITPDGIGFSSR